MPITSARPGAINRCRDKAFPALLRIAAGTLLTALMEGALRGAGAAVKRAGKRPNIRS
jgi:hypothetical protein